LGIETTIKEQWLIPQPRAELKKKIGMSLRVNKCANVWGERAGHGNELLDI